MNQESRRVNWLAVQPTPYNYFLYKNLVKSETFDFHFFYMQKTSNNLRFNFSSYCFDSDSFISDNGVKRRLLLRCLTPSEYFVFVGWESTFKLFLLILRRILNMKYAFWTDSINCKKIRKQSYLIYYLKKWLLSGAEKVMTTGDFGVEQMKASHLVKDADRIVSLPFFVEGIGEKPTKLYRDGLDTLEILVLARLIPEKGIAEFLSELAVVLRDAAFKLRVTVGGIGPEENRLRNMIQELGLQENVNLVGWIDQDEKRRLMLGSHLLMHPVKSHDPFPLVVLESLAHGLPVVGTSHAGSVCDRVQNGINGFILNEGLGNLGAIFAEARNPEILEKLSKNAFESAQEWPGIRGLSIVEDALLPD